MVSNTPARLLMEMENANHCTVHLRKIWTTGVGSAKVTVCVESMEKPTTGATLIPFIGDTVA